MFGHLNYLGGANATRSLTDQVSVVNMAGLIISISCGALSNNLSEVEFFFSLFKAEWIEELPSQNCNSCDSLKWREAMTSRMVNSCFRSNLGLVFFVRWLTNRDRERKVHERSLQQACTLSRSRATESHCIGKPQLCWTPGAATRGHGGPPRLLSHSVVFGASREGSQGGPDRRKGWIMSTRKKQ